MNRLVPGQAAIACHEGKVCLVVCDERENLPIGKTDITVRSGLQQVAVVGAVVPVVIAVLRVSAGDNQRFYTAWINELTEGVLETLANQPDLPGILTSPLSESVGQTVMENKLRPLAQKIQSLISTLAKKAPWGPRHFAAARNFVEAQYPSSAALWAKLGGE